MKKGSMFMLQNNEMNPLDFNRQNRENIAEQDQDRIDGDFAAQMGDGFAFARRPCSNPAIDDAVDKVLQKWRRHVGAVDDRRNASIPGLKRMRRRQHGKGR